VAGGIATRGLEYAAEVGAEAIQVFVSNPRGWAQAPGNPSQDAAFAGHVARTGLPVFVHASYLVNLGSPDAETVTRSAASLRHALRRAARIGARDVVVHTGSAAGGDRAEAMRQVHDTLLPLLEEIPGTAGPGLLLEPMAGQGQMLCAAIGDLGPYLDALERHPRVGICLDTCHAFAAGHDLDQPGGAGKLLAELDQVAGPGRLKLVHANDSADGCGSRRDRHANIGAGKIGEAAFAALLRDPVTAGVPFIVETPGKVTAQAQDVAALKRLRDVPGGSAGPGGAPV
jgi:deoxyribonuclease IV